MRAADLETIRGGVPSEDLMENAASALCRDLHGSLLGARRVVVVCGPGKNGGDGLAAARLLALAGSAPTVFSLRDPDLYSGESATNAARARAVGLPLTSLQEPGGFSALRRSLVDADVVVDALFGTGLARALGGAAKRAVAAINAAGRRVLAADLPSGLSADSGSLLGPAVRAWRTVAFGAPKLCHVLPPASGYCGSLAVADIGISSRTLASRARRLWLAQPLDIAERLPARPLDSHKGDFGRVAVLAGSRGKPGAAILAARGALRGGAGLVTVFCPESAATAVVSALPEAMVEGLAESAGALAGEAGDGVIRAWAGFDAAVVGPGLGTSAQTVRALETLLVKTRVPLVADADALNAFAGRPGFFARRRAATVLTPHPGEAGRLLGQLHPRRPGRPHRRGPGAGPQEPRGRRPQGSAHAGRRSGRRGRRQSHWNAAARDCGFGRRARGRDRSAPCRRPSGGRGRASSPSFSTAPRASCSSCELGDAGLLAHELADAIPRVRRALRGSGGRRRRKTRQKAERRSSPVSRLPSSEADSNGGADGGGGGAPGRDALALRRGLSRGGARRREDDAGARTGARPRRPRARGRLTDLRVVARVRELCAARSCSGISTFIGWATTLGSSACWACPTRSRARRFASSGRAQAIRGLLPPTVEVTIRPEAGEIRRIRITRV